MKLIERTLVYGTVVGLLGRGHAIDCAPSTKSYTIKITQDATDISTCSTFAGSIVVAADGPDTVTLDGITSISGNIDVENVAALQSLSSSTLTAVASLTLANLPQLSNLSFPALTNFSSLAWNTLPKLEECTIASGSIEGEIQGIAISNTSLKSLEWLKWPVGTQMNISSNSNLQNFSIQYATINGGSALTLTNNPNLTSIDVSLLTGIYGGLEVSENGGIEELDFAKLEDVGGFVQLSGGFTNVSMPVLTSITGALTVGSTADIDALCNDLQNKKLAGHFTCTSDIDKAGSSNPSATSGGSAATSTSTSTSGSGTGDANGRQGQGGLRVGAIAGVVLACIVSALLALVGAFFYFRRRVRAKVQEITQTKDKTKPPSPDSPDSSSLELGDRTSVVVVPKEVEIDGRARGWDGKAQELESPLERLELNGEDARLELPGRLLAHELEGRSRGGSLSTVGTAGSQVPLVRHELPA